MRASLATRHRREYARAIVVLVSGLLIWVATGLGANADSPNKLFTATVTTSRSMVAGGTYNQPSGSGSFAHVVITFTNLYPSAPIQAIQVGVPQGITVLGTPTAAWDATSETPTVFTAGYRLMEFDNVSITTTQSLTVTIDAVAECFPNAGDYTWTARAKQANSFSGDPGNDFNPTGPTTSTISGSCSLKFDAQPKDAIKNTNITSKPLDPTPPGVKVGVYDGSGSSHVTWWETNISITRLGLATTSALSGYTSASPGSTGIAEFIHNTGTDASPVWVGPTLATSAAGYSMRATTSLLATTAFSHNNLGNLTIDSDPLGFVIVDDGQICESGKSCSSHSSSAKLDAIVQSTTGGSGELLVSIAPATTITVDCSGYTETTETVDFNVTATDRSKTVTVTIYGGLKTKSASKWQACYRAPYSFQQLDGTMTAVGPDDFSVGLLPDCPKTTPTAGTPPCVSARLPNSKTKDMVMVITARPGDPKLNF